MLAQICNKMMGQSLSYSRSLSLSLSFQEKERESEREKKGERKRERKNGQNGESGHLHLAVLIFSRSYQITNKHRFQRRKKRQTIFFCISAITHRKIKIINIFNLSDKI
jgi:hypothetical protein